METLLLSLFLGLAGGIFTGGVTSLVLFFMGHLTFGGMGIAVVNSFIVGLLAGSFAGIIKSLALPLAAIFETLSSNSELAIKLVCGILTIPVMIIFFVGTIWTPILTSRHSEMYIWNWPGVESLSFHLFLKSPIDRIDLLECDPTVNPQCKIMPSK